MSTDSPVLEIIRVQHLVQYELKLEFNDGTERIVDFQPFLENSKNPLIRLYLDPERFANFRLDYGDLVWDDYGLCFPIADLYEGRV
ncbi:MAG: hypothetical protein JWM21_1462 [Acidobacteria bacterium]|nr:hypothetical protein [Acidobacteriota bacterium]